jgi:hypothetical protein
MRNACCSDHFFQNRCLRQFHLTSRNFWLFHFFVYAVCHQADIFLDGELRFSVHSSILKTQSTLVDIPILPMKRLRPALTPRIAATIALIALPLISLAEGSVPADAPAPAENSPVINTLSLDTSLSGTPGSLNLSETREIDLWERIRGGFAIPDLENKNCRRPDDMVCQPIRRFSENPATRLTLSVSRGRATGKTRHANRTGLTAIH